MKGAVIIEGHVQGLSNVRSIGELGAPVIVIDMHNCIARYSKYCQNFFKCPPYASDEFADFLLQLADKEKLQDWLLIPSNDHAVHTISRFKSKIEKHYKTLVPDLTDLMKIYDKKQLLDIASNCNVPIPKTQTFKKIDEQIHLEFPILTKGRNGLNFYKKTGKKVFLSNNQFEFEKHLKEISKHFELEDCITQEIIPENPKHKTVSFTCFAVHGEIKAYWTGIKLREHPLRFGTATYAKSIEVDDFMEQSEILIKKMAYTGVCEIEYLFDERTHEYKLIEINPRTWLWVELSKSCGVDYAKMMYSFANDMSYQYPDTYKKDIYWMNHITDLPFSVKGIIKGKYSFKEVLKSYLSGKKFAIFKSKDPLPFLSLIFLLPLLILKR